MDIRHFFRLAKHSCRKVHEFHLTEFMLMELIALFKCCIAQLSGDHAVDNDEILLE